MSRSIPVLALVACLTAASAHAQQPAAEPAAPAEEPAEPASGDAAPGPAGSPETPQAPAEQPPPPAPSTAPRAEPAPPPVRDFPVPHNTPPPKPDFDAPRFPDRNSPGRHSVETGFHLGVPVFLTADSDVDPGFAMGGRIGFVAGFVVPEFGIAWQGNSVDGEDTLDAMMLSFGARLRMNNSSSVTPFISGAFDMNFWHFTGSDELVCRNYCEVREDYGFSPGVSGVAGLALSLSPRVSFDVGLRVAATFAAGILDEAELWLTPQVGLGFYYR